MNKYYFISKFDTNIIDRLDKQTTVIYRNYNSKIIDEELILKIKKYCKSQKIKFFLSNNVKLAIRLNLDGIYIPSFNKTLNHLSYSMKKKFEIIGSAHNLKEIRIKERQKVKKIFLSSIFKKNGYYLGLNKFNLISKLTNKEVIALGGVSTKNKKLISLTKSAGFAGISFFK